MVTPSATPGIGAMSMAVKPTSPATARMVSVAGAVPMRPDSQWPVSQLAWSPQAASSGNDGHGRASHAQTWLRAGRPSRRRRRGETGLLAGSLQ